MIFTILVAMIPLSILSQGVTNSTVYSPDCKKAINAVDASCKAQLKEWIKLLKDPCPKDTDCTAEKVKSICPRIEKFNEW
jgi:hypothetical protein